METLMAEFRDSYTITHCGRLWGIHKVRDSWFVRDHRGNDTGPYSTSEQAEEWVRAIQCS
jgi:hypothetical protein